MSRETIVLHAFTSIPNLAEHFAPVPLAKNTPQWWKQVPLKVRGHPDTVPAMIPSIRHCYAIRELFSRAVMLPLWADHMIVVLPDGRAFAHAAHGQKPGEQHLPSQYLGMLQGWTHFKFWTPWVLHTDRLIHFYYTHPFYHYPDPGRFQIVPGITEFHFQNQAHANCIFPVKQQKMEYLFNVGDPIAYLIPLEDIKIVVKAERVSELEMSRLCSTRLLSFHTHKLNRKFGLSLDFKKSWLPWKRWAN